MQFPFDQRQQTCGEQAEGDCLPPAPRLLHAGQQPGQLTSQLLRRRETLLGPLGQQPGYQGSHLRVYLGPQGAHIRRRLVQVGLQLG